MLLKATAKVGAATITSRVLGFIRDMVLARYFGASGATDAFFLAFKIPNFMRRLFAEGSFSLAFVPVLSEVRASGDRRALKDLVDHVAGTLAGADPTQGWAIVGESAQAAKVYATGASLPGGAKLRERAGRRTRPRPPRRRRRAALAAR